VSDDGLWDAVTQAVHHKVVGAGQQDGGLGGGGAARRAGGVGKLVMRGMATLANVSMAECACPEASATVLSS
jgi:hypothetical protein